jgi:hypothetical protein
MIKSTASNSQSFLFPMSFIVLHIPHSSKVISAELRSDFLISGDQIELELLRMTDHYTDCKRRPKTGTVKGSGENRYAQSN